MKLKSKLFYSYLAFVLTYSCFTLLPAPAPATLLRYHVNALGLRLIDTTIVIIVASIWFVAFYGYEKLRAYTRLIKGDKDGAQTAYITKGIFLLALWLPVAWTVSAILSYIGTKHPGLIPATVVIGHYLNLLFPLAGFVFIGIGARGLRKFVRQRTTYASLNVMAILLIYLGLIYYRLVVTTYHRAVIYGMSIWLILLTLVAPYVYMWFVGLLAAHDIYRYQRKVAGIVYRESWRYMALGLAWLIMTSISFQYLTTLVGRLNHLSIYWLLAIIYSLLIVLSLGFVFVALGARKLQRIEEV